MRCAASILAGILLISTGCADSVERIVESDPSFGPHGGPLVQLPGRIGYAEIVAEPLPNPRKDADAVLAVYLLTPDLKSSLAPIPTDVSLSIRTPGVEGLSKVAVEPLAKPKEKFADSRLASKPGQFLIDQLSGDLTLTAGGETVTKPFAFPR